MRKRERERDASGPGTRKFGRNFENTIYEREIEGGREREREKQGVGRTVGAVGCM